MQNLGTRRSKDFVTHEAFIPIGYCIIRSHLHTQKKQVTLSSNGSMPVWCHSSVKTHDNTCPSPGTSNPLAVKTQFISAQPWFVPRSGRCFSGQLQGCSASDKISAFHLVCLKLCHTLALKSCFTSSGWRCFSYTSAWHITGWAALPKQHLTVGIFCLNRNAKTKNLEYKPI